MTLLKGVGQLPAGKMLMKSDLVEAKRMNDGCDEYNHIKEFVDKAESMQNEIASYSHINQVTAKAWVALDKRVKHGIKVRTAVGKKFACRPQKHAEACTNKSLEMCASSTWQLPSYH